MSVIISIVNYEYIALNSLLYLGTISNYNYCEEYGQVISRKVRSCLSIDHTLHVSYIMLYAGEVDNRVQTTGGLQDMCFDSTHNYKIPTY